MKSAADDPNLPPFWKRLNLLTRDAHERTCRIEALWTMLNPDASAEQHAEAARVWAHRSYADQIADVNADMNRAEEQEKRHAERERAKWSEPSIPVDHSPKRAGVDEFGNEVVVPGGPRIARRA